MVDGLAIHEEPFVLEEGADGVILATPAIESPNLISDSEISSPDVWELVTYSPCTETLWTHDTQVGHDAPGSWRIDANGAGTCSQLRYYLSEEEMEHLVDGRYVLSAWIRDAAVGEYGGPYSGSNGQVTMGVTYMDDTTLKVNSRSIGISNAINQPPPISASSDGSEWYDLMATFVIDPSAHGGVKEAYFYARSMAGTGTYWMDDMVLERIDGKLQNVAGGVHPLLVTGSDNETVYIEGLDYEVCQLGETSSGVTEFCTPPWGSDEGAPQYETVFWANNWGETLRNGLEVRYSRRLEPFEIRWFEDGAWPADDTLHVSYDVNYAYQGQHGPGTDFHGQCLNFCSFDAVFDALDWGAAFDRVMGHEEGQLGADLIKVRVSEVRGVGRSVGCFEKVVADDDTVTWEPTASTGALFANVSNRLVQAARERDPDMTFFMWDDMFNPFTNGGYDYQVNFGGVAGKSACALGPEHLPGVCEGVDDVTPLDPEVVMLPWTYKPSGLRKLVGTGHVYDSMGRPWLAGPGGNDVVDGDWYALAQASSHAQGATIFPYQGGNITDLAHVWNHDWRMRYLVDFETVESSQVQFVSPSFTVTEGVANQDATGYFANYGSPSTNNFTRNFDGGMEVVPPGSEVTGLVASVSAEPRRRYRVALHTRRAPGSSATASPRARVHFDRGQLGEQLGDWLEMTFITAITGGFERYEIDASGVESPAGTVGVSVEISLGADGEFDAFDDILLFESVMPCFDDCDD